MNTGGIDIDGDTGRLSCLCTRQSSCSWALGGKSVWHRRCEWGRPQLCRRVLPALVRSNRVLVQPCSLMSLSHSLWEPRPRRAESRWPTTVGATKGRRLSTCRGKSRNASLSCPEPALLGRPRSNVVAEESNEGRIRWMSRVPHRIDQDECRCNERFCNIPTKNCLGARQTPRLVLQLAMMDREIEAGLWDGGLDKITGLGSVAVGTRMDRSWQRPTPYEQAAVSTQ